MKQHQEVLSVATSGRGFLEVTDRVQRIVASSGVRTGLLHVYCCHTSCSLCIQENADPSARRDMEDWLERIAPEHDPRYTHTSEGPDDMPSHLRSMVTKTTETIPIGDGRAVFGTWQGLYLCEHRTRPHTRRLVVHVIGEV
ncbi:MAG: secondary thiamine-phosphate synthase enzyme YjbQ [Planctomycetota bacterium]|jgi:secondary thiamine-phosphate synthase enzyme